MTIIRGSVCIVALSALLLTGCGDAPKSSGPSPTPPAGKTYGPSGTNSPGGGPGGSGGGGGGYPGRSGGSYPGR